MPRPCGMSRINTSGCKILSTTKSLRGSSSPAALLFSPARQQLGRDPMESSSSHSRPLIAQHVSRESALGIRGWLCRSQRGPVAVPSRNPESELGNGRRFKGFTAFILYIYFFFFLFYLQLAKEMFPQVMGMRFRRVWVVGIWIWDLGVGLSLENPSVGQG